MEAIRSTTTRVLLVAVSCSSVGIGMSILVPYAVGAYTQSAMDLGIARASEAAGWLASAEMFVTAMGATMAYTFINRYRLSALIIAGSLIVILANLLSIRADFSSLYMARVVAGAGAGLALGVGNAIIARCSQPDRLYGLATTIGSVVSVASLVATPPLMGFFGISALFGVLAATAIAALMLVPLMPPQLDKPFADLAASSSPGSNAAAFALLGSVLLVNIADGGLYAFTEVIARRLGLKEDLISVIISAGALLGVLGAALAALLGLKLGRAMPVCIALTVKSISGYVLTHAQNPTLFAAMTILTQGTFYFAITYLFGLGAALDRTGRLASLVAGAVLFGSAIGPAISGYVIDTRGVQALALVLGSGLIISAALFSWSANHARSVTA